ncbi:MAG: hypothetical protein IJJ47_11290 [Methanosphaera sp.]|nr:hypothetical protein [Methanosphaera sp.]
MMPSVSIIRSDKPNGPADEGILRREYQKKRTDPEAEIIKEFLKTESPYPDETPENKKFWEETADYMCEKLGGITYEELLHKFDIWTGYVEDDEREWREKKYGKPKS